MSVSLPRGTRAPASCRWLPMLLVASQVTMAAPALAATWLRLESTEPAAEGAAPEQSIVWAEPDRIRVDLAGGRRSIVYRLDRGLVWSLDHEARTVLELDRRTATQAAEKTAQLERELRAQAESLPPSMRPTAEELLESAFGQEPQEARAFSLHPVGAQASVREIPCARVEIRDGETRIAEFCEATLADAGVARSHLEPVRSLAGLAREIAPLLPASVRDGGASALDLFDRVEGIPLRVTVYDEARIAREIIVQEIASRLAPATTFELPADYQPDIRVRIRERIGGP